MNGISDEMLMSYVDGELDGAASARVEAVLVHTADVRARLAAFQVTGRALGQLFDRPMCEPVPQHLIDAVMRAPPGGSGAVTASATILRLDKPLREQRHPSPRWMLAAACLALLAVAAGSRWIANETLRGFDNSYGVATAADGAHIAGAQLAAVLETTPSGTVSVQTIDGAHAAVKPVLTFAAFGGRYCRQYEVTREGADNALAGVGCRDVTGRWQVEGQVVVVPPPPSASVIRPAGNGSSGEIDAITDRLISSEVFGLEEEAGVMKEGWQRTGTPALDVQP